MKKSLFILLALAVLLQVIYSLLPNTFIYNISLGEYGESVSKKLMDNGFYATDYNEYRYEDSNGIFIQMELSNSNKLEYVFIGNSTQKGFCKVETFVNDLEIGFLNKCYKVNANLGVLNRDTLIVIFDQRKFKPKPLYLMTLIPELCNYSEDSRINQESRE